MKTIKTYECFNQRRYSNPWVAIVGEDAKINFAKKVGGYTGAYGKGEAGELYITEPVENAVYAYGQKDYRGSNTELAYIQYRNGQLVPVEKTELIAVLSGVAPEAAAEAEPTAPTKKEPEKAAPEAEYDVAAMCAEEFAKAATAAAEDAARAVEEESDEEDAEELEGEEDGETKEAKTMTMYRLSYTNPRGAEITLRRKAHDAHDAIYRLCDQYGWSHAIHLVDADTGGRLWVEAFVDFDGWGYVGSSSFDSLLFAEAEEAASETKEEED